MLDNVENVDCFNNYDEPNKLCKKQQYTTLSNVSHWSKFKTRIVKH